MTRARLRLAAVLAAATLGLAGCAEDSSKKEVDLDARSTPTAEPTPVAAKGDKPVDGAALRGSSAASSPDEEAAVEVWFGFYEEMVRMYAGPTIDRDRWSAVAVEQAYDGPLQYAEKQVSQGHRHQGGLIVAATEVEVKGDEAVVTGCVRTTLTEVDGEGVPVEKVAPWRTSSDVLVKVGSGWRVSSFRIYESGRCDL
ncbi:hypothetical protein [Nocardioides jishulii]|uniref:Nuclear transport factor 2 family protein n=1 Tax=Nocardioides jishulii TaxID=2575440 RepID=A0A4U2YTF8_9ACTN|nr:hypothetical protein [Nocardioides jishulii]QCX28291.1 hypothetical protein FCL41_12750 [Nocardioides jishulii]TKI64816.1 hypothetical protein FC770_06820 [Nocardioides jishulii]